MDPLALLALVAMFACCIGGFLLRQCIRKKETVYLPMYSKTYAKPIISLEIPGLRQHKDVNTICVWKDSLFSGSDTITHWDFNGLYVRTFRGHSDLVTSLRVFSDHLYSCSKDRTVRCWDWSGNCIELFTLTVQVTCLCIHDNEVFGGGARGDVHSFGIKRKQFNAHNDAIINAICSWDSNLVTAAEDGTIKTWSPHYNNKFTFTAKEFVLSTCVWNHLLLTGCGDGIISAWNLSGECEWTIGTSEWVSSLVIMDDFLFTTGCEDGDGIIRKWDWQRNCVQSLVYDNCYWEALVEWNDMIFSCGTSGLILGWKGNIIIIL